MLQMLMLFICHRFWTTLSETNDRNMWFMMDGRKGDEDKVLLNSHFYKSSVFQQTLSFVYIFNEMASLFIKSNSISNPGGYVTVLSLEATLVQTMKRSCITSGNVEKMPHVSNFNQLLVTNAPCHHVKFKYMDFNFFHWKITAHKEFMLNISVYTAYVLFSDGCADASIQMYEIIDEVEERLELLCGHVHHVSTYTSTNEASLIINSSKQGYVDINVAYQIHPEGYARTLETTSLQNVLPLNWNVTFSSLPSEVIYVLNTIQFKWFMRTSLVSLGRLICHNVNKECH